VKNQDQGDSMLTQTQVETARQKANAMLADAGVVLTPQERDGMEVVDFGLGRPEVFGLQIVVYVNNDRYCAKELVLFPGQTCAEHIHPDRPAVKAKTETFRCRHGVVYLYIEGSATPKIRAKIPDVERGKHLVVRHEIILNPGEQFTLPGNTKHWFQAGPEGAVVSEFSSTSDDPSDIFTDPVLQRRTTVR
jgi:D-lyxose ketol-isomerase